MNQDFTSVGDSAMGKYPQNRFRRLVIVEPADNKPRQQSTEPRWWEQWRSSRPGINQAPQTTHATWSQSKSIRMPVLSRGLWSEALIRTWNVLRGYFVTGPERKRGAVILSFRRPGMFAPGFGRPGTEEAFVSKKANGSVRWNSDREVAPQEGGRG
jgi:hypothetical protein